MHGQYWAKLAKPGRFTVLGEKQLVCVHARVRVRLGDLCQLCYTAVVATAGQQLVTW